MVVDCVAIIIGEVIKVAEEFQSFIHVLLDKMNPYPQKNSVLVLDNASAHHFEDLYEMVEEQ